MLFLLLALGLAIGPLMSCGGLDDAGAPAETATVTGNSAGRETATALVRGPGAERETVQVVWVTDGDSIDVETATGRDEIRLLGINAPESDECHGEASTNALVDLVSGRSVTVTGDERDQFGRRLAVVWVDEEQVNASQVRNGHAVARSIVGNISLTPAFTVQLDSAEVAARNDLAGMWAPENCGSTAQIAITFVNFDAEGRDDENPNGEWIDLENTGATPINLAGWTVRDESTRHRFVFEDDIKINPGEVIRIRSGCTDEPQAATTDVSAIRELHWCAEGGPVWSNSGDTAFLLDASGNFADVYSWESVPKTGG